MAKIPLIHTREKKIYTIFTVVVIILFAIATVLTKFNPLQVIVSSGRISP